MSSNYLTPEDVHLMFDTSDQEEGICANCMRVESKCSCVSCAGCGTFLADPGDVGMLYEQGLCRMPAHARFIFGTIIDPNGTRCYCSLCWQKLVVIRKGRL